MALSGVSVAHHLRKDISQALAEQLLKEYGVERNTIPILLQEKASWPRYARSENPRDWMYSDEVIDKTLDFVVLDPDGEVRAGPFKTYAEAEAIAANAKVSYSLTLDPVVAAEDEDEPEFAGAGAFVGAS